VKRGGSLSFLVGTFSNVLVMEIGWTDVGSGWYILVSCEFFIFYFVEIFETMAGRKKARFKTFPCLYK
jgi:hypothetical protein